MPYVTQADLIERFGARELAQLTDESAAQTIDAAEVTKVCDEASSLVDAYLSARYALPLTAVPTLVRKWTADIARKFLWKDRAGPDSVVTANADTAIAQLKDIVKGNATLPGLAGVEPAKTAGGFGSTTPTTVFDTTGLL